MAADQLAPRLQALGVTGRELRWFICYMTGGRQSVVWDGTVSSLIDVLYGVRQGSILGPLLFIIHFVFNAFILWSNKAVVHYK
jgi:hypothetical protein